MMKTPIPASENRAVPMIYGTAWKEEKTEELCLMALQTGFRAIDTANQRRHYVEAAVGQAVSRFIQRGAVTRNDLFLQTKFTYAAGQDHRLPFDPRADYPEQVQQSFQSSLEHLQTEYLDSYILHGPSQRSGLADADRAVWRAMEALQRNGKTRFLGISNVTLGQLQLLVEAAEIKPTFVQNRCFAQLGWDAEVRYFCREQDIHYQGFSLLTANRFLFEDQTISRIAAKKGKSIAQIIFRFVLQVGMIPLTGSTSRTHLEQDLLELDFSLATEELAYLEHAGLP